MILWPMQQYLWKWVIESVLHVNLHLCQYSHTWAELLNSGDDMGFTYSCPCSMHKTTKSLLGEGPQSDARGIIFLLVKCTSFYRDQTWSHGFVRPLHLVTENICHRNPPKNHNRNKTNKQKPQQSKHTLSATGPKLCCHLSLAQSFKHIQT